MACNCNDNGNIYNISMGCCVPVVANADNYYTKGEVDEKLDEVVISGGGVTHNEMVNYVSAYTYDKATINQMIVSGGTFDPTQYYTTNETDERIVSATSAVNNELTAHTSNNNIHVTAQDKNNWNNKSNFSGSYNDLTDKPTIPTVPTSNTAFTNDAGYITSNDLDGYATEQWVLDKNYASSSSLSGKQDTLISTVNIKTVNNQSLLGSGNITIEGGGSISIDSDLDSGSTNAVANSAITNAINAKVDASTYNTYTAETATEISNKLSTSAFNSYSGAVDTSLNSKASQSDLSALTDVVSAHTANTNIHVTAQDKTNWDAKADSSALNNYMLKSQIWCGDETAWSQISGSTQNDVIYLVY